MYPSVLFSLHDGSLSRYWVLGNIYNYIGEKYSALGFPEWVNDGSFYEKLIDANKQAIDKLNLYVDQMDQEFKHPEITSYAEVVGDNNWVSDENFEDAWESNPLYALTRSPKTKKMYINPHYNEE